MGIDDFTFIAHAQKRQSERLNNDRKNVRLARLNFEFRCQFHNAFI